MVENNLFEILSWAISLRGVTRGGHDSPGAEALRGAEKSQLYHYYFLQYSTFASEKP